MDLAAVSGAAAVLLRRRWELIGDVETKRELLTYNMEDCRAAETVTKALVRICEGDMPTARQDWTRSTLVHWKLASSVLSANSPALYPEFEKINSAAYWDYQRSKVYVRTNKTIRRSVEKSQYIEGAGRKRGERR